jgi:hypothetical protein
MNGGIGLKNIFGEEAWALLRTSLRFSAWNFEGFGNGQPLTGLNGWHPMMIHCCVYIDLSNCWRPFKLELIHTR